MIFCVEDEQNIRELLVYTLGATGFDAKGLEDGKSLLKALAKEKPELILLDIMLPGEDGYSILARLKSDPDTRNIPVILVTARESEFDKVKGLDGGADDYVTKPFGVLELAARIRSLLRRTAERQSLKAEGVVSLGGLTVNTDAREVSMNGAPVVLTYKEYELLMYLVDNRSRVVERDELLNKLWDYSADIETRTLDIHIRTLRQKLGEEGSKYIKTVRSVGYRFVLPQETEG